MNEYDFQNASEELWLRFNLLIQKINFEEEFESLNTHEMLEKFYLLICRNVDIIFDRKGEGKAEIFTSKNKIPRKIRILMRNKKNISKSILKSKSGTKIAKMRKQLHEIETSLEEFYQERRNEKESEAIKKIKKNPKFFYSYARKFSKLKSGIGPFLDEKEELINDNFKMAEMLRSQYEKSFSEPFKDAKVEDPNIFFQEFSEEISECLSSVQITHQDVIEAIDSLSTNAAPGPDYFPAILLKKGKFSLCHPLTTIYRSSLETGEVPEIFRTAYVTPIHKSGPRTLPVNYRPVSLTSHLAKTMERVLRKPLVTFLEVNKKMNVNQHGFRQGRSCLSQLLEHYDNILKILEDDGNADCIYLDFSKCFDKIDTGLLCHKLKQTGVNSKMGIWLHNFLVNRKQYIISGDTLSQPSDVISGIPQGTVMGPILFLIFICDIDSDIESIASMFCDDTRLLGNIKTEDDVENLQNDLDKIYSWAEQNNMLFNNGKFELLRYGQDEDIKAATFYLSADNEIIEEKEHLRDLGVIVNNKGNYDDHITHICAKVKQKSGWILRTFQSRQPFLLKLLWKQLVQPHIDYCSQLFPLTTANLVQLENLQRNYLRRISTMRESNYWERLKLCQMLSQQRRLERYKILYIWKILEHRVPNCGIEVKQNLRLGRLCEIPGIKKCSARIVTLRENSFQVQGPKLFNILPPKIRNMTGCSIDDFKFALDQFLMKIPDEPNVPGAEYTPTACNQVTGKPSNSLVDQVKSVNMGGNLLGG